MVDLQKKKKTAPVIPRAILEKKAQRIDLNDFLTWIMSLDIAKYPAQSAIILRVQNYKRPAFVKDTIQLVNLFMEGRA